jgi:hypothetical protein
VPASNPDEEIVTPSGSTPSVHSQVPSRPVFASCWLYAEPVVPSGTVAVVIFGSTTVSASDLVPYRPVAVSVNAT